jgi:serine protease Do
MDGAVIGINSAIFSPSGGSVGVGFAIPSNMAREVVDQLRQYGQIRRGWLGVRIQQVTSDIAEGMGLTALSGALVADVTPGGPAAKAGIQEGDIVTGFDGKPVPDSRTLPRIVADTPIGKTVAIDVLRKGKKDTLRVTVARLEDEDLAPGPIKPARPAPPKQGSKLGQLGFTLAPLDTETRGKFKIGGEVQGAVITDIDPNGPAADNNLSPGDVIVQVQNEQVHTPDDVARHVAADAKAGRKVVLLLVNRDGNPTYVALRLTETG